jgi:AbrB family looped-hinge helix DNA binding protein
LPQVRVKRNGQVTIPVEIRSKLGIDEGALLDVEEEKGAIVLGLAPRLKGGQVVGEEEYGDIIRELDHLRKN